MNDMQDRLECSRVINYDDAWSVIKYPQGKCEKVIFLFNFIIVLNENKGTNFPYRMHENLHKRKLVLLVKPEIIIKHSIPHSII